MKIKEIQKTKKHKIGQLNRNGVKTESSEDSTLLFLTQFGFDIEIIKPIASKRTKNPDIIMLGTIWEIKTPTSTNKNTIKNRFREASKQSTKIIFDLRHIKKDSDKAKSQILAMFKEDGRVRRMIIIETNDTLLDVIK